MQQAEVVGQKCIQALRYSQPQHCINSWIQNESRLAWRQSIIDVAGRSPLRIVQFLHTRRYLGTDPKGIRCSTCILKSRHRGMCDPHKRAIAEGIHGGCIAPFLTQVALHECDRCHRIDPYDAGHLAQASNQASKRKSALTASVDGEPPAGDEVRTHAVSGCVATGCCDANSNERAELLLTLLQAAQS